MTGPDGTAADTGALPVERRRSGARAGSPMDTLRQLPALVAMERFPVPVLAIGDDGAILFANSAFAEMLGHSAEYVVTQQYREIFETAPVDQSAVIAMRSHADQLVDLRHADGSTVRAKMSNSALLRGDDPVALAVFQDLTEQLWLDEM
ncbi:PAS domain-containing protein [soil metagenome]